LPGGRILDASETAAVFPNVNRQGLRGGALWHDAVMLSPERVLIEMLRWAGAGGASALNYVEAERLIVEDGEVRGVGACDRLSGERLVFRSPCAINAAGPWCQSLAAQMDRRGPELFHPALAFNLLLDRPAIAEVAVAIEPKRRGARMYFVLPWRGRMLAGTFHAPAANGVTEARPTGEQVAAFLDDLNAAVPGLGLRRGDVVQIYAGLLPARREGDAEPASRERIHDHDRARRRRGDPKKNRGGRPRRPARQRVLPATCAGARVSENGGAGRRTSARARADEGKPSGARRSRSGARA
jgi:glycerol-3-phosphate dehydrogenase